MSQRAVLRFLQWSKLIFFSGILSRFFSLYSQRLTIAFLPDLTVQDERFSLSASHPLAFISLLYTFWLISGLLSVGMKSTISDRYYLPRFEIPQTKSQR